jgi:predicted nucleotidyltransferase
MEQKSYKLEIVYELLKGPGHVRGLAKRMHTNHMLVSRKMDGLTKENVADFRKEGRNKVFFIKKTLEARSYVFMAENYALARAMNKYPILRAVAEKIREDSRIRLAVLFGSYAKGSPKNDSDIDIYVETDASEVKKSLELVNTKISVKTGTFNPESLLIKEIIKNHVILKGVEDFYEKSGFFK